MIWDRKIGQAKFGLNKKDLDGVLNRFVNFIAFLDQNFLLPNYLRIFQFNNFLNFEKVEFLLLLLRQVFQGAPGFSNAS